LKDGAVRGIKARGGFEFNLSWKAGKLEQVEVLSSTGNTCRLRYTGKVISLATVAGKKYKLNGELREL